MPIAKKKVQSYNCYYYRCTHEDDELEFGWHSGFWLKNDLKVFKLVLDEEPRRRRRGLKWICEHPLLIILLRVGFPSLISFSPHLGKIVEIQAFSQNFRHFQAIFSTYFDH